MSDLAYSGNKVEAFQAMMAGVEGDGLDTGMTHVATFTNVAGDSLPFHEDTTLLELFATADCWVLVKESTSSGAAAIPANKVKTKARFIPSDVCCFIGIPKKDGVTYMLSIIRASADGSLYMTEGR